MPKAAIPHALQMRELKYGTSEPAERDRVAQALAGLERRSEAVLLYEGRADHPFLRQQLAWAADHGDAFLLILMRKLGVPVEAATFKACASVAEGKGRWLDARQCYVALGDTESLVRISPNLPAGLAVAAPPPPATQA
jgi:hypothetical protein